MNTFRPPFQEKVSNIWKYWLRLHLKTITIYFTDYILSKTTYTKREFLIISLIEPMCDFLIITLYQLNYPTETLLQWNIASYNYNSYINILFNSTVPVSNNRRVKIRPIKYTLYIIFYTGEVPHLDEL